MKQTDPRPWGCPLSGLLWLLGWLAARWQRRAGVVNPHWPGEHRADQDSDTPDIYITRRGDLFEVETVWLASRATVTIPNLTWEQARDYAEQYPGAAVHWPTFTYTEYLDTFAPNTPPERKPGPFPITPLHDTPTQ